MPCNCRPGVGAHDHLGDGFVKDGAFGVGTHLNSCVELSGIQVWNSLNNAKDAQLVFDPEKSDNSTIISSDSDPELLISVPLTSVCHIRGIIVKGPLSDFSPKNVKIFVNQPDINGFDSVRRLQAQETIELSQSSTDDVIIYRVNTTKFLSVGYLTFFFDHSFNDELTHLLRIELFGDDSGISRNPKVATNIVYELRANPADHRVNEEVQHFVSL